MYHRIQEMEFCESLCSSAILGLGSGRRCMIATLCCADSSTMGPGDPLAVPAFVIYTYLFFLCLFCILVINNKRHMFYV